MLIVRYRVSNPNMAESRGRYLDDHKEWLRTLPIDIVLSGPASQPSSGAGVAIVIAMADSICDFSALSESDPFVQHGVYSDVSFIEWNPTRGRLLPHLVGE